MGRVIGRGRAKVALGLALLIVAAIGSAACGDGGEPALVTPGGPDGSGTAAATSSVGGRTFYVASDGDDAAEGSAERPWRTIQHAADVAVAGDTVVVRQGTYQERVTLARSGEEGKPITFRASPGEKVTLDGGGEESEAFGLEKGVSHVRLEGFVLQDFRVWTIFLHGTNKDIEITDIETEGGEGGIHMTLGEHGKPQEGPVEDVVIRDSNFHDHVYGGIDCTPGPCNRLRIIDTRSHDNGGEGDWGADGIGVEMGDDIVIEGCQVYGNGGDGIDLNSRDTGAVSNVVVSGCSVWGNGRNGIKLWRGGQIVNSLVHSSGSAGIDLEREGRYEIVNSLVASSGLDGDYGVVVAYPEESQPPQNVTLLMRNSIFAFNNGGVYLGERVKLEEDYNLYFSREDCEIEAAFSEREDACFSRQDITSGAWLRETGNGQHSLAADPRFVDPKEGDYHLRGGSPAMDSGSGQEAPAVDMAGQARPQGGGYDMGPFEGS
ncbi:MAG: right-handed parallel beta-helix repeat-containing protein [Chloroflexota bacterium]|nr:right-handed parallel beta-helix repeat-containing protein [Chloroflexota bacterium]